MNAEIFIGLNPINKLYFLNKVKMSEPNSIIDIACDLLNSPRDEVIGKSRKREIVECRHIAMGVIRHNTLTTLKEIGKLFNRDHSSVIYAIENFKDLYGRDKEFTKKADMVKLSTNK